MERLERFYRIDRLLKERAPVPFADLQRALEVSRATLKRDLDYMRDRFNAPIEYDRATRGYRFGAPHAGPRYELPGLWFSADEAHALLTMRKLLVELDPGLLGPQFEPLLDRLRAVLGSGEHSWQEVESRIRILQPGRRGRRSAHFGVLATALLRRRRLRIWHYHRAEDRETTREVSPQRLVHYRDNWYLDAWCHLRKGLRSFAVDAIRDALLLEARAKEVGRAALDEILAGGYGIFAGQAVAWATLRFSPQAARWAAAQTWHPQQRARAEADGHWTLELPYADDRELLMDILRYGADVEVLGPPAYREAMRRAADLTGGNIQ